MSFRMPKEEKIFTNPDGSIDLAHYENRARALRSAEARRWFAGGAQRQEDPCDLPPGCLGQAG